MDDATLLSGTPALAPRTGGADLRRRPRAGLGRAGRAAGRRGRAGPPSSCSARASGGTGRCCAPTSRAATPSACTASSTARWCSLMLAKDQLGKCRARVEHHLGADFFAGRPIWHRPPYGIGNEAVPGYAGPVGWHAHGRDWDITYRNERPAGRRTARAGPDGGRLRRADHGRTAASGRRHRAAARLRPAHRVQRRRPRPRPTWTCRPSRSPGCCCPGCARPATS